MYSWDLFGVQIGNHSADDYSFIWLCCPTESHCQRTTERIRTHMGTEKGNNMLAYVNWT